MKTDQDTLSVGILGAGGIVQNLHLPVLLNCPGARVAWIADKSERGAKTVADAFRIRMLSLPDNFSQIPDVDVLLIAIPYGVREPYYQALRGRRLNLYIEKPFASSVVEHQRLASWFASAQVGCGFQRRSWTAVDAFLQILREQLFGPIRRVRVSHGNRGRLGGSRYGANPQLAGHGILMEAGIHLLDLAFYTLEATEIVEAKGKQIREFGFDVHTQARLMLRTRQLGEFPINIVVSGLTETEHAITVEYDRLELSFAEGDGKIQIRAPGSPISYPLPSGNLVAEPAFQQCGAHWMSFLQSVRSGKPNRTSASDCILTTEAVEKLYGMAE